MFTRPLHFVLECADKDKAKTETSGRENAVAVSNTNSSQQIIGNNLGTTIINNNPIIETKTVEIRDNERRIVAPHVEELAKNLVLHKCKISLGIIGTAGDAGALANQIMRIAEKANCETKGINTSLGLHFEGITLSAIENEANMKIIYPLAKAINSSKLGRPQFIPLRESEYKDNDFIFIRIGYKPN